MPQGYFLHPISEKKRIATFKVTERRIKGKETTPPKQTPE